MGGGGEEAAALIPDDDGILKSSNSGVKEEPRGRLGPEDKQVDMVQADFAEGIGAGLEEDVMGALLETSEGLVAAVETQQKVSDAS